MSSIPLFKTPDSYLLPFSKGGDFTCTFVNNTLVDDEWVETPYGAGVTAELKIDISDTVTSSWPAEISGAEAFVKIESEEGDAVVKNRLWRLILIHPTTPDTTEQVAVNGLTMRADGGR